MKHKYLKYKLLAFLFLSAFMGFGQSTIISGDNLNIGSGNSLGSVSHVYYGNAIGTNNHVVSPNTLAVGADDTIYYNSTHSVALGSRNYVEGLSSMAFGSNVKVVSDYGVGIGRRISVSGEIGSMAIGTGVPSSVGLYGSGDLNFAPLTNSVSNSLAIGFNSTKPTLFVSESPNDYSQSIINKTGRVAIGDVTPQAKLHIRSDNGEDAGIILAPASPSANSSFIRFRDNHHHITVNEKGGMEISSGSANALAIASANLNVTDTRLDLGRSNERKVSVVSGTLPALYSNAHKENGHYYRFTSGPSYAVEFGSSALLLRTAVHQDPRTEITNWRDALSVKTNGAITINGKVGVNVENTTNNFALAVDGGIIATEVYVMEIENWPDYVFEDNYKLMPLNELKQFIGQHGHLPEIPSAKETAEKGCDLGEMHNLLLKKIEELSLYIIQQEERISQLEKELNTKR